jgi:hypothetical protein
MTDDSYKDSGGVVGVVSPASPAGDGGRRAPDVPPVALLTDLNGYDPQSIRDGKKGKVQFFFDPTHIIARAFGGRQWFFDEGVLQIHRIGLLSGLGWILPYTGGNQDINCVKVVWSRDSDGVEYNMEFGRVNRDSVNPPETWQLVKRVVGVHYKELLEVYNEVVG